MSSPKKKLPEYAGEMADFHAVFGCELRSLIAKLPLEPTHCVLDAACGDGFYTRLLAERVAPAGMVVGLDVNQAYLGIAQRQVRVSEKSSRVCWICGTVEHSPLHGGEFDLVWLAQSLFSLPEPRTVVQGLAQLVRPGGIVALLENDTLHQALFPWPVSLEIALRAAERRFLARHERPSSKFYVGRRLLALCAEAGLEPVSCEAQASTRTGPFSPETERFFREYLRRLGERAAPELSGRLRSQLRAQIEPDSPRYLLHQPQVTVTWINFLSLARRPLSPRSREDGL